MGDTSKLVFEHAVEGLLRAVKMTPELKQRLKQAGLDLDQKLLPAYPADDFNRWVDVCGAVLYPDLPLDQQQRRIGADLVDGYLNTFLGTAIAGVLRVLGPKRTLLRTRQNFRSGNNYSEVSYEELGPTEYRVWCNEPPEGAQSAAGTLEAGLRHAGARDARVEVERCDALGVTFRVRWS